MTQLDLLTYPASPGFKAEGPSREAAEAMKNRQSYLLKKCFQYIGSQDDGCTADECAAGIGESVLAVRPRFSELLSRRLIYACDGRRKNASGRSATVWRVKA